MAVEAVGPAVTQGHWVGCIASLAVNRHQGSANHVENPLLDFDIREQGDRRSGALHNKAQLRGFGFAGQNNPTLGLLPMLQSAMQKQPETFTRKFNAVFTTPRLIMIVGLLTGILFARMLGA
jgi:hypothetical protein